MEPKSISFSAGAAILIYTFLFPDLPLHEVGQTGAAVEAGSSIAALTAVITPFANVGKSVLARLVGMIETREAGNAS